MSLKPLRQTPLLQPEGHGQQGTKAPPGPPASLPTMESPMSWHQDTTSLSCSSIGPHHSQGEARGVLGITMIVALPRVTTHRDLLL